MRVERLPFINLKSSRFPFSRCLCHYISLRRASSLQGNKNAGCSERGRTVHFTKYYSKTIFSELFSFHRKTLSFRLRFKLISNHQKGKRQNKDLQGFPVITVSQWVMVHTRGY